MWKSLRLFCLLIGMLLSDQSVQGEELRRDRYGDPLPPGAIARLGTTRLRHLDRVFDMAFSPDGKMLASVGEDHRIRLWDASTGRQLRALPGHPGWVLHVAFSPNGKLLASASHDNTVRLWNVATGRMMGEPIWAHSRFVAFSPDSKLLVFTNPGTPPNRTEPEDPICFWDIAAGKVIQTWTVKASASAGAFSPDGRTFALVLNEWAPKKGEKQQNGKPIKVDCAAILCLRETATGKELWRSAESQNGTFFIAFSPDGKTLASAGGYFEDNIRAKQGAVLLWDAATGKRLHALPGLTDSTYCVRFSADGKYLAAQGYASFLWELKAVEGPRRIWEGPESGSGLAFAPDSRRLAWGSRQAIRLIDLPPRNKRDNSGGHNGSAISYAIDCIPFVAFAADGKTVVSVGDRVRIWDAETGAELRASSEPLKRCAAAVLSPDGKTLITGCQDSTTLWDLATLKALRTFASTRDSVVAMALSPDGKTLAATMEHTVVPGEETGNVRAGARMRQSKVQLWDVQTGKEKEPIGKGTHAPQLAFSPDGSRLAGATMWQDGLVRIWDVKTGNVILDLKSKTRWGHDRALLCFSPDGKLLASAEEGKNIALWDAHSGGSVRVLRGPQEWVHFLAFSPDGKTLLSGGEDTLWLWDVATGKLLHELVGHQSAVETAAFSPDGKRIASASQDTTILIWDVPSLAKLVRPLPPPLTEEELQCLWVDLGSETDTYRHRAIRRLASAPKTTLAFLKPRLKPDLPRDDRLARLLEDLDSDSFSVRENASRDLAQKGASIKHHLRRRLSQEISPEARQRIQALLEKLPRPPRPQRPFRGIAEEERRLLNLTVLLDRIATADALDLMKYLNGSSEFSALLNDRSAWGGEVREAKDALARRKYLPAKP